MDSRGPVRTGSLGLGWAGAQGTGGAEQEDEGREGTGKEGQAKTTKAGCSSPDGWAAQTNGEGSALLRPEPPLTPDCREPKYSPTLASPAFHRR